MKPLPYTTSAKDSGFTILESLFALVVVGIAAAASTTMFVSALQGLQENRQQSLVQAAIEANKAQIDQLARRFTCCSGSCTTSPPTTFGAGQPCATNNPNDNRYYFPQLDLDSTTTNFPNTTTPSEPNAVDQLCESTNNTNFMAPLKNAIDELPQPSPATRSNAVILAYKMLRVEFRSSISNAVIRALYVKPRMANFCP